VPVDVKLPPVIAKPPVAEATVIFAVPSNDTPPIVREFCRAVAVAAFPPIDNPEAVPVKLVATPPDGVPRAPPEYRSVAEASGRVNVFSAVVGPVNFVNPFPVPPKLDAMICVRAAVPSKLFPYIARGVWSAVAVPAFPEIVV
jgi:hypothetical protein